MKILDINSWDEYKQVVADRDLTGQYYDHGDYYSIFAKDDYIIFQTKLTKDEGANVVDFETNYKTDWNSRLEYRTTEGILRTTASPRPDNTHTVFMGVGDNSGYGLGNRLIFNMTAIDVSKSIDNCFDEDVYIKDGIIITKDAPLGSYIEFLMYDNQDNLAAKYCEKVNLLGTQRIDLNSEDTALFPQGFKLKTHVCNSDGTNGQDAAAAFQVIANLEMYRASLL